MDTKGIMIAIVTIAIGVILTTGVLIPIIQDVSSNNTETGVKSITAGLATTWLITDDGKLFGTGDNSSGQQGSGTADEESGVTEFTQRLTGENVKEVVINDNTTWAITTDGKLFGTGANTYGQQGSGTAGEESIVTEFTQRLTGENVKEVVISNNTTWAITTDGKLFGCGDNTIGQQGSGDFDNVLTFTQRLSDQTVEKVICSSNTTWAITTDGKLFGAGANTYGQQGSGDATNVATFTQRLTGENIKDVFSSSQETWVVTTDGKLFGCGRNNYGQQGSGNTTNVTTFTQRLTNENIKDVFGSAYDTWVVTTDGKLFGCGRNNYGQQGSGTSGTSAYVTSFTQRLTGESVKEVVTSEATTWVITDDGKLFGCGRGSFGQQGSGDTTNVTTFTQRLSDQNIANVNLCQPTGSATWAITTDGKLFSTGGNSYGEQGDGTTTNVTEFTQRLSDQNIANFILSTSYGNTTWVITDDGKLFSAGDNSYGQQGIDNGGESITEFTLHDFGGSGSSISVSPTISAMLSVIPLIVVVGLIVGTIGYFMRRQ